MAIPTSAALSPFDQTTQNLLKLGSLTMSKFAQDPSEELDGFDISVDPANSTAPGYYPGDTAATRHTGQIVEESDDIPNVAPTDAIRYLREVAQKEFGTTSMDPFKFEFLDEPGPNRKCCILTISRPNGLSRSYRTKAGFTRKSEAKVEAANSAIQLGAVRFIKYGEESKVLGKRSLVLAKLDASAKKEDEIKSSRMDAPKVDADEPMVSQIELCCTEWRAGSVVPVWVYLTEQKVPDAYGCALKIMLSPNIQRTYSVAISADYPTKSLAQVACARVAQEQDVLEFIRHGDGLEHPVVVPFEGAQTQLPPPPPTITTLQAFHAALPQPLPDYIGVKGNGEVNAVAWLNTLVQAAKGSRMTVTFNWHFDTKPGLHGCLLRLSRPDGAPSLSYLVDAVFPKRADAKIAVCLLACSQGVGDYIRRIAAEVDSRVTVDMKRRCAEHIFPSLGQALNKLKHGSRPDFSYDCDLSTFGCTLTVDLSPDPGTPIRKQWKVPLAYKSKGDAKIAVACIAADDGLMDFLKCRGKAPSPVEDAASTAEAPKRVAEVELEEGETTMENEKKKRRRRGRKGAVDEDADADHEGNADSLEDGNVPLFETREEALARGRFGSGSDKKQQHQTKPQRHQQQQRNFNSRGRGGNFARSFSLARFGSSNANAWGMVSQSGFGAPHSGSFGFPGFFSHHPGVPPAFHASDVHASPGPSYPSAVYESEFEPPDHGFHRPDPEFVHGRSVSGYGRTNADAMMPFAYAQPPAPPHMAPGYSGYHEHEYDSNYRHGREYGPQSVFFRSAFPGTVFPPGPPQPYHDGYQYSAAVLPPLSPDAPHAYHHSVATEYSYEHAQYAGRPAQGASSSYEPEHYAPDFDRIPDRTTEAVGVHLHPQHSVSAVSAHLDARTSRPPHSSSSRSHVLHSQSSGAATHPPVHSDLPSTSQYPRVSSHYSHSPLYPYPPRYPSQGYDFQPAYSEPHAPAGTGPARAPYDGQVMQSVPFDETMRRHSVHEHEQTGALARAARPPGGPVQSKIKEVESVISRFEKEADERTVDASADQRNQSHDGASERSSAASSRRESPNSHKSPSPNPARASDSQNVPSKRRRSPDPEGSELASSKRLRSISRASDPGKSSENNTIPEKSSEPSGQAQGSLVRDNKSERKDLDRAHSGNGNPKGTKRKRENSPTREKKKGIEQKDKSYVTALYDHCEKQGVPRPELYHEEVVSDEGTPMFNVWIIMGKERLELPTSFRTLDSGQERVAKSVLGRLRVQGTKKRKEVS